MHKGSLFLLFLILFQSSTFSQGISKTLTLSDHVYEPEIKTVRLYPNLGHPENQLLPSITSFGTWNLQLEFDDLREHGDYYYVRIVHCNKDWSKSSLMDLDFLNNYNEYPISQYEYSTDTQPPYIHYWFEVPEVKLPGNYVAVVYRGSDKDDVLLSKRFMVYDNRVTFNRSGSLVGSGMMAQINQQLNFTINYKSIDVFNPLQDISVTVRQNQRWDNIATQLKPSFVREGFHELEYQFFDQAKMFKGGNEFRFFDIRSLNYPGQNIEKANKKSNPYTVSVFPDKARRDQVYSQYRDYNGGYIIDNLDYRNVSACNYIEVNFTLIASPVKGKVYVNGAFNYWNLDATNEMTYDAQSGVYRADILLKQGWYDYQYLAKAESVDPTYFEGSHYETENMYEIFVYWRPSYQPQADLLVGYVRLGENSR